MFVVKLLSSTALAASASAIVYMSINGNIEEMQRVDTARAISQKVKNIANNHLLQNRYSQNYTSDGIENSSKIGEEPFSNIVVNTPETERYVDSINKYYEASAKIYKTNPNADDSFFTCYKLASTNLITKQECNKVENLDLKLFSISNDNINMNLSSVDSRTKDYVEKRLDIATVADQTDNITYKTQRVYIRGLDEIKKDNEVKKEKYLDALIENNEIEKAADVAKDIAITSSPEAGALAMNKVVEIVEYKKQKLDTTSDDYVEDKIELEVLEKKVNTKIVEAVVEIEETKGSGDTFFENKSVHNAMKDISVAYTQKTVATDDSIKEQKEQKASFMNVFKKFN